MNLWNLFLPLFNYLIITCHSLASTKVDKHKLYFATELSNKSIKLIHNTHKMNKVVTQHKALEQLALFFKKQIKWSIRAISCELDHSDNTTSNVLHGHSHNLEHYIEILSFLGEKSGWKYDFSCIEGMMERVVGEGNVLIVGRMNEKSEEILEVEKVVFRKEGK